MYTVITIDDEPLVKKTLRVLIEGYPGGLFRVVDEAEDGRDGLARIERHAPDLVITDLNMPVMNGLEMIERLRQAERMPCVAVLSGYSDFEYAQQALRYGVVDFVLKPIKPEAIRELLDRVRVRRADASAAVSSDRGAWVSYAGDTAKEVAERVWLLDEAGAAELLERFAARVETAEGFQALVTLVSSELERRGAGALPPPPIPVGKEATLERLRGKIEELGRQRRIGNHQGIRAAVAYLETHFQEPGLSLTLAADAAGMSPAHFSRTFKREMGVSFIEYVTTLRIERAKALLDAPGTKTWEIAEAIGYQEYATFAKVFRKSTGMTPTEYRKREG